MMPYKPLTLTKALLAAEHNSPPTTVIDRAVHNSPPMLDDVGGFDPEDLDEKDPERAKLEKMALPEGPKYAPIRQFETGATRDTDVGKYDYEAFLNPLVIEAFGAYMHKHRHQADGTLRDGDNWQKGIPMPELMKSLLRHTVTAWRLHRGYRRPNDEEGAMIETLCAVIFNAQGYLLHLLNIGFACGGVQERKERQAEFVSYDGVQAFRKSDGRPAGYVKDHLGNITLLQTELSV